MRALAAALSVLAPITVIVTGWWNLVIRKRVAEARIDAARRGVTEKIQVQSTFGLWTRRILTATVVGALCIVILFGLAVLMRSVWELFS